jgi:excisionase family DNA binding protein
MTAFIVFFAGTLWQDVSARRFMEMVAGDLLTTKEAAELLRVSPWTISAWLSQGKLKRVKAGGRTLIAKAELQGFILRSTETRVSPERPLDR